MSTITAPKKDAIRLPEAGGNELGSDYADRGQLGHLYEDRL
jgi:hypothetical protein